MKNWLTSLFLLLSLSCFSQFGINAGLNLSAYASGNYPYTGIKNVIGTPKAGIYDKIWFNKTWYIQPELDFLIMGATNPTEKNELFETFNIYLPVVVGFKTGYFSMQAGGYVTRMYHARNFTWYGVNTFNWYIDKWDYLYHYYGGGTVGVGWDFIDMEVQINYMHDFIKAQHVAWDYNVKKLGYNHALSISAYIPLFNIKNKNNVK